MHLGQIDEFGADLSNEEAATKDGFHWNLPVSSVVAVEAVESVDI
jgi:hypothetical protein